MIEPTPRVCKSVCIVLLDCAEVADALGVCERTIWSLVAGGKIPTVRIGRRSTRFRVQDVEAYIESRRRVSGRRSR